MIKSMVRVFRGDSEIVCTEDERGRAMFIGKFSYGEVLHVQVAYVPEVPVIRTEIATYFNVAQPAIKGWRNE